MIIIEIYIYVCIMLLLFNIGFLVIKNIKNHEYYPKNDKFKAYIEKEFQGYSKATGFSNTFKEELSNKIKKTKNLVILENQLELAGSFREEIALELRPLIFNELENYKEKSDYEQAYYTYVISKLDYTKAKADGVFCSKFIGFLGSESLYTFTNTMNAIYSFGDPNLMVVALEKVNERNGFYHKKLLVDGLLTFSGDYAQLNKLLKEKFYRFSPSVQESLVDYFRLNNVKAADLCIDILKKHQEDSQVLYSAMRYFAKFPNVMAKQVFIDILKDENAVWLEQMLAIQGLNHYSEASIKRLIGEKIVSSNWYVRTNAVAYLHGQNINKEEIYKILLVKDKYANEALLYQYKNDESMSRYIMDTMESLKGEEIESKEVQGDFVVV